MGHLELEGDGLAAAEGRYEGVRPVGQGAATTTSRVQQQQGLLHYKHHATNTGCRVNQQH